jgi:hypothetical protein
MTSSTTLILRPVPQKIGPKNVFLGFYLEKM